MIDFLTPEPFDTYKHHAATHLSSHALATFRRCPAEYAALKLAPQQEEREAFAIGTAAHALILEGEDALRERFILGGGPINEKTGEPFGPTSKAFQSWLETQSKDYLTREQAELVFTLAASVKAHPLNPFNQPGLAEHVCRTAIRGYPCQARPDYFTLSNRLYDLKTCDNLRWFESDAKRFEYPHQLAFYRQCLREASGETFPTFIIAVEKRLPFRTGIWEIMPATLDAAEQDNAKAIELLQQCEAANVFPTHYEEMRVLC